MGVRTQTCTLNLCSELGLGFMSREPMGGLEERSAMVQQVLQEVLSGSRSKVKRLLAGKSVRQLLR